MSSSILSLVVSVIGLRNQIHSHFFITPIRASHIMPLHHLACSRAHMLLPRTSPTPSQIITRAPPPPSVTISHASTFYSGSDRICLVTLFDGSMALPHSCSSPPPAPLASRPHSLEACTTPSAGGPLMMGGTVMLCMLCYLRNFTLHPGLHSSLFPSSILPPLPLKPQNGYQSRV